MSQYPTTPEFILEESEKTHLTERQQACLSQILLDLEVDLRAYTKELSTLVTFLGRIQNSVRELRLSLLEQE